jgi:hypothetical protein
VGHILLIFFELLIKSETHVVEGSGNGDKIMLKYSFCASN